MKKHSLRFIAAALLLALTTGCVAETGEDDESNVEELLIEDEQSSSPPDVHGDGPVHLPTEATPQRHDPPPNPWKPQDGFSNPDDDDDPDMDIEQLPEMEFQIPR